MTDDIDEVESKEEAAQEGEGEPLNKKDLEHVKVSEDFQKVAGGLIAQAKTKAELSFISDLVNEARDKMYQAENKKNAKPSEFSAVDSPVE